MEKKYLKISEFARLRNVSIGSLRYYEKLKILVPARIDSKTGYRYYLPEQLGILDSILLCISLNIPLKDLQNYIDEKGVLDQKRILTNGKKAMQEKIKEMQTKLDFIQFNLDQMERNEQYGRKKQVYTRTIEERFLIAEPIAGNWKVLPKKGESQPMQVFHEAQKKNMTPVFPAGVLVQYEQEQPKLYFYFQVMHPDMEDPRILHIPAGNYSCLQADISPQTDMKRLIDDNFPTQGKRMIIISNMMLNETHFDSLHSEIQIIPE